MTERVITTIQDHIATVVLNRPEKMNALDQAGFEQLALAGEQLAQNSEARVVVLCAEGDNFCAGADKSFLQGAVSDPAVFAEKAFKLEAGQSANYFQKPAMVWNELDIPVIACVQGVAYGAGMQVALAADMRIGCETTAMSLFEIHWGLIPDMGVSQTLLNIVKADTAAELLLTGRAVKAQEALEMGLLTRVADNPKTVALELAQLIAQKSPDATRRGKKLLRECVQLNRADALALEASLQSELVGTPNQMEAAMANIQKRPAKFS